MKAGIKRKHQSSKNPTFTQNKRVKYTKPNYRNKKQQEEEEDKKYLDDDDEDLVPEEEEEEGS